MTNPKGASAPQDAPESDPPLPLSELLRLLKSAFINAANGRFLTGNQIEAIEEAAEVLESDASKIACLERERDEWKETWKDACDLMVDDALETNKILRHWIANHDNLAKLKRSQEAFKKQFYARAVAAEARLAKAYLSGLETGRMESKLAAAEDRSTAIESENARLRRAFLPIDTLPPIDTFSRERLGALVRYVWIKWAKRQPSPKPTWLVPYAELSEPDKEADRMIGENIAQDIYGRCLQSFGRELIAAEANLSEALRLLEPFAHGWDRFDPNRPYTTARELVARDAFRQASQFLAKMRRG